MALSPWPAATATVARAAAIATLRTDCGIGSRPTDDEINRIGEAVAALVEREAPGAPEAIKTEAVIRLSGYIFHTTKSQGFAKESLGPRSVEYSTDNHAAMFRNSGAKGLLASWKIRRAGVIG